MDNSNKNFEQGLATRKQVMGEAFVAKGADAGRLRAFLVAEGARS